MKKRLFTCIAGLFAIFLAAGSFWPYQQASSEWRYIQSELRSAGYTLQGPISISAVQVLGLPTEWFHLKYPVEGNPDLFLEASIYRTQKEADEWDNYFATMGIMANMSMYYRWYHTPHIHLLIWSEDEKDSNALYKVLSSSIPRKGEEE